MAFLWRGLDRRRLLERCTFSYYQVQSIRCWLLNVIILLILYSMKKSWV